MDPFAYDKWLADQADYYEERGESPDFTNPHDVNDYPIEDGEYYMLVPTENEPKYVLYDEDSITNFLKSEGYTADDYRSLIAFIRAEYHAQVVYFEPEGVLNHVESTTY